MPSVESSAIASNWRAAAEDLKKSGITVAPKLFTTEADYLRDAYIDSAVEPLLDAAVGTVSVSDERASKVGNTVWKYVSLTDPILASMVLSVDLVNLIYGYYNGQPYLRRMPFIKQSSILQYHEADVSGVYHIDQGKHFVGVMLLLSDISERDSHMRYLLGTHRYEGADFRLQVNDPGNLELDAYLETKYQVFPLVGQKGTMFVYDNGNGIHKGHMIAGTTRNVMQATFSRGDHEVKPKDRELLGKNLVESVAAAPEVVRNAITHIL